jgi:hypothetical protein
MRKKTTSEAAPLIGISHKNLITYILRYPELRPVERLPNNDYFWDEAEIEAVIEHRAQSKRGKVRR